MCGITGLVRFDDAPLDAAAADVLVRALAHRGPDGEGVYRSPRAFLGHRRLAIIDPTPAGAQPMAHAGRWHIVYNGEVYNYRELRAELEGSGERFETHSDTEVLLRLLTRGGAASLSRVRGMFALALWDEQTGTLTLARDRFGIKPLYFASDAERIVFASEIAALRRAGLVSRTVSPAGMLAYLSWASIPAPLTWLAGVHALEPGTWRRWSASGEQTGGRFAHAAAAYATRDRHEAEPDLNTAVPAAVRDTVRAHLVSDVPVGVFLSSGIDSGAIVSAARSISSGDIHTYTVTVDDADVSEGSVAADVAAMFGTTHHELRVDAGAILRDLPRIVQHLDQPTADGINTYCVAQAAAQAGVRAVLSGVGGDEMFGGYPSFTRVPSALRLARAFGPSVRLTGGAATLVLPAWKSAKWRHFAEAPDVDHAYRSLRGLIMPDELDAVVGPALADQREAAEHALAEAEHQVFTPAGHETAAASVARMETTGFLRSQLLRDVDVMSMAHGLEVRVPFVDHELQRAVWPALGRYPSLLAGKRLLHATLANPLPPAVTSAPKRGFTLPFDAWMRGDLRDATRDGLRALSTHGWLTSSAPDDVWRAWTSGQAHWSRVWALSMLGRFLEEAP